MIREIAAAALLLMSMSTLSGCLWGYDRGEYGDRDRGGYREQERGEHGDRDRGGYREQERGEYGDRDRGEREERR